MTFRHHLKIYNLAHNSTLCSRRRSYISVIRALYLSCAFTFLQHFSFKLNPLFPEPSGIGSTMHNLQHKAILCKLEYNSFFISVLLPQNQNSRTLTLLLGWTEDISVSLLELLNEGSNTRHDISSSLSIPERIEYQFRNSDSLQCKFENIFWMQINCML